VNTSKNNVALVTGASDGIGAEFVEILAGRGYDLILVARREEKLNELAVRLSDEFGVECTVMAADLSEPKAAQNLFQRIEERGLKVNFLINNAGLLHNGFFANLSLEAQEKMIQVNVIALTALTHLYAAKMSSNGGGHILECGLHWLVGWLFQIRMCTLHQKLMLCLSLKHCPMK
jgi:short-subunit dehydrogenase